MVNWYGLGFAVSAATVVYLLPKRYFLNRIINYYTYRTLFVPPKTIIVLLDNIGLNYEKARMYAKNGARVILAGQNKAKLETARKELMTLTKNKNIITVPVDRFDIKSLKQLASVVISTEVRIDAIVNNQGRELSDLDIIFATQELSKERFENHCLNFLYNVPEDL